jgi:hypothetical protein
LKKNLKFEIYDKNNQIDIIELNNVVKFENWMYKIENKDFELENLIFVTKMSKLEILKSELLNIKILKSENVYFEI